MSDRDNQIDRNDEPAGEQPGSSGPADPLLQDPGAQQFAADAAATDHPGGVAHEDPHTVAAAAPPMSEDGGADQEAQAAGDGADGGEALEGDLSQLLQQAESQRDEYLDLARRAQADFENYRKRSARDVADARRRGAVEAVSELLPVVDNLERALQSLAQEGDHQANKRLSRFGDGVRLVLDELVNRLKRLGVEPLEPTGERFDPNLHEALTTTARDGVEPGVVLEVAEKGYRLGDAVVRPARVVVSS